jgi:hypothetical protein
VAGVVEEAEAGGREARGGTCNMRHVTCSK